MSAKTTEAAIVLDSPVKKADVSVPAQIDATRSTKTFLNLEHVTGMGRLPQYDVFVEASPSTQGSSQRLPLLAGSLSVFGVQKASRHSGSGITTVLDITDAVEQFRSEGGWDEAHLEVIFERRKSGRPVVPINNLQVGRVSISHG